MHFLKNYFLVFVVSFLIVLLTKFIFSFYLSDNFLSFSAIQIVSSIFWEYKFDFAISAIIAFLVTLLDFNKKLIIFAFKFLVIIVFLIQISDIFYFYESSRHLGYEIKDAFQDSYGLIFTAHSQHTFLTILAILFTFAINFGIVYMFKSYLQKVNFDRYYVTKKVILLLLTVFFVRGMFQGIPLNPWQSTGLKKIIYLR
jgi:hypothetical protein